MKPLVRALLAVALAVAPRAALAQSRDPLSETDQLLKEAVKTPAWSVAKAAPRTAGGLAAEPADFCVSNQSSGPKGMPSFQNFSCTNGVKIDWLRRFCFTSRCTQSLAEDAVALLRGKGYELLGWYYFGGRAEAWNGHAVFRRAGLSGPGKESHCLALRNDMGPDGVLYRIDCGDGAVTTLKTAEPSDGTSAIERYMGGRGYELLGPFAEEIERGEDDRAALRYALFRRRAQP